MKRCKTHLIPAGLIFFFLAVIPMFSQDRGSLDINGGESSDRFDGLSAVNGAIVDINGEVTIKKPSAKRGGPSIIGGGQIRLPSDSNNHAKEYAVFGGFAFQARPDLSLGFNIQLHKLEPPAANVDNQFFVRGNFVFLEIPLAVKYNFGPDHRLFIHLHGAPEFSPRYRRASSSLSAITFPAPNFDHGYFVRGSLGYSFGHWYVQGTYETRYLKFEHNPNNPSDLYNWKSNMASAGVGVSF